MTDNNQGADEGEEEREDDIEIRPGIAMANRPEKKRREKFTLSPLDEDQRDS